MSFKKYQGGHNTRKAIDKDTVRLTVAGLGFGTHMPDPAYEKASIEYDQNEGLIRLIDQTGSVGNVAGVGSLRVINKYHLYRIGSFGKSGLMPKGDYEKVEGEDPHTYKFVRPVTTHYRVKSSVKKSIIADIEKDVTEKEN